MKTIAIRNVVFGEGKPKVCIPIVGQSREEIYRAAKEIMKYPVDLVEWRADWYGQAEEPQETENVLEELRRILGMLPILVTFRTREEGGERELSPEAYTDFNCRVIESGLADFVDVEFSKEESLIVKILEKARRESVYVILSSHDFQKTPTKEEIIRRLCSMQTLGGDMVKMAVMPNCRQDVLTLMEAVLEMKERWADRPVIAMAMAGEGAVTRLIGEFFGSAVTFAAVGKASAPGQIPVEEMNDGLKIVHRSLEKGKSPQNLYLIGFMGSGKSAVASVLEKTYHLTAVEMDQQIERQQGMKISEIFASFGEGYFRKEESRLLKELGAQHRLVVSCGGGIVLKPENVECMHRSGKVILLTAEPETILERVRFDEKRPLLKGKKNVAAIRELMESRRKQYEAAADIQIATDGKSLESIAKEIVRAVQL